MALPQNDFTTLERAVLDWLEETYRNERLTAQVNAATFNRRDWTKVGYYVYFDVPRDLPPLDLNELGGSWPVDGPGLKSEEIDHGGDTIFWGSDGYIDCMEMYSFGDYFSEEVREFELQTWEKESGA